MTVTTSQRGLGQWPLVERATNWWAPSQEGPSRIWNWPEAPGGRLRLFLLTASSYAIGSWIARLLLNESGLSAVFFIPAGLTVGILLRTHRRLWWVTLAAAAATEYLVNLVGGYTALEQVGFVLANVAEPLIGAAIVSRWCGQVDLARLRHVLWFVIGAVILAPAIGAAVGSAAVTMGAGGSFESIFFQWWLGDALGVILIGGGILAWGSSPDRRTLVSFWGLVIVLGTMLTLLAVIRSGLPLTFLVLTGIILAGAVYGTRAVMVTALTVAGTFALDIAFGSGILIIGLADETALMVIKLRVAIFTLAGLVVAAEAAESARSIETASVVQTRLQLERAEHRIHREVAQQLQTALLPQVLAEHPSLHFAARYEAGGGDELIVGGDWYDIIELPDGRVMITIGDVVGHGIEASAAMSRMRTAISVLSRDIPAPGALLDSLCEYARGPGATPFATAAVTILDPETGSLTHASAGHLPLLLVEPDGSTRWLSDGRSSPLGCATSGTRPQASTSLSPGTTLVAFTDGLVERRGEDLAHGLSRLSRICENSWHLEPPQLCDRIVSGMSDGRFVEDDAVILVARYRPESMV